MKDALYQRALFKWAINKLGNAFGWSLAVAFVVAFFGALAESWTLVSLAGLAGAIVFALILSNSSPPFPSEIWGSERAPEPQRTDREPEPKRSTGAYQRSPENRTKMRPGERRRSTK